MLCRAESLRRGHTPQSIERVLGGLVDPPSRLTWLCDGFLMDPRGFRTVLMLNETERTVWELREEIEGSVRDKVGWSWLFQLWWSLIWGGASLKGLSAILQFLHTFFLMRSSIPLSIGSWVSLLSVLRDSTSVSTHCIIMSSEFSCPSPFLSGNIPSLRLISYIRFFHGLIYICHYLLSYLKTCFVLLFNSSLVRAPRHRSSWYIIMLSNFPNKIFSMSLWKIWLAVLIPNAKPEHLNVQCSNFFKLVSFDLFVGRR